jgi:hypothetical protein
MEAAMSQEVERRADLKLNYSHEAMIDLILAEPSVTNKELAEIFSYSEAWVSHIRKSDSFQARIAERKAVVIDPRIRQNLEDRLAHVATSSIAKIQEKLESSDASAAFALDALGVAVTGLRG